LNYLNDDAFGSRLADAIMNESYYSGIEDEKRQDTKGLTKAEENAIIKRLAELMKGCGGKRSAKKI
jgi:hypothetical protein